MKKNKNKNNIKNIYGGISVETVVTYSIILTVGGLGVYYLNDKFNISKENMSTNIEDDYEDKDLVIHVEEDPTNIPITDDDSDTLLGEVEEDDLKLESLYFQLDLNGQQERITTFTLDGLKEIDNITTNNGNLEILSIEGDVVTVKITNGDIKERVVISGQYVASETKTISEYPTANYSDADGFVGTLTIYLDSYSTAYSKAISINEKSLINSFPLTVSYTEDGVTMNLVRTGASIANVIKGSNNHTKYITNQATPNYTETIDDNGKIANYNGTLTQYVHSGSAPVSKTSTTTQTNITNAFPTTITFQDGNYSGTLTKSGASTSVVTKGSNITSKQVIGQPTASYSETVTDNGKNATYTGTLTAYVSKGSVSDTKNAAKSVGNDTTTFDDTVSYSETVMDNGITTTYIGTLTKTGTPIEDIIKGSASASKTVNVQPTSEYSETINDNGVTTTYTGTLNEYVYQGSASSNKAGENSITNISNEFDETIPYSESITDNGINTTYTGTLSKSDDVIKTIRAGSASANKTVIAQTSPNYDETINDNGISTAYVGTLSAYVYQGSASLSKDILNHSTNNNTGTFNETIPYSETINDNGIVTTYTGTLSKSGNMTSVLSAGSASISKSVTNQTSSNYNEGINDNGVSTAYSGTLTSYVASGSVTASKNVSDLKTSSTNSFSTSITYNEGINDNGVTTSYSGSLSKNGNSYVYSGESGGTLYVSNQLSQYYNNDGYTGTLTQYVASGSAAASKSVSNQTSAYYSDNDGYTGTLTQYVASGSAAASKSVSNQTSSYYSDNDGYTGTLTQYVASGSAGGSKTVTDQPSAYYSDNDGYTGTLTQYLASGSAPLSRYVTAQTSAYYNSGGYSGTLSSYIYQGSASNEKTVTAVDYYNWGWHCTNAILQHKAESIGATEYLSKNPNFIPGSEKLDTSKYNYNEYVSNDNGRSTYYSGILPNAGKATESTYRSLTGGSETGLLLQCPNGKPTPTDKRLRYTVKVTWRGTVTKPDTRVYRYQGTVYTSDTRVYRYRGTVTKPDTRVYRYQGTVNKPDTRVYRYQGTVNRPDTRVYRYQGYVTKPDTRVYAQAYSGTVTKPDTRVIRYSGTVTKPDTRIYTYTQVYSGTVTKPDTIVTRYQGTVTKPDTRLYNYTQNYSGTVTKPDTRVYKYQGTVRKPDTRVYGYRQNYIGTVTKPDTREYLYQGTVVKPDTREYEYTQRYSGTTWTEDTRVYRYQGNVTKLDTREYEYTQNYSGVLNVPERPIYLYKGNVTKPAIDTRVFDNLYQYTIKADYYK